jgi:hypothetical protein
VHQQTFSFANGAHEVDTDETASAVKVLAHDIAASALDCLDDDGDVSTSETTVGHRAGGAGADSLSQRLLHVMSLPLS